MTWYRKFYELHITSVLPNGVCFVRPGLSCAQSYKSSKRRVAAFLLPRHALCVSNSVDVRVVFVLHGFHGFLVIGWLYGTSYTDALCFPLATLEGTRQMVGAFTIHFAYHKTVTDMKHVLLVFCRTPWLLVVQCVDPSPADLQITYNCTPGMMHWQHKAQPTHTAWGPADNFPHCVCARSAC